MLATEFQFEDINATFKCICFVDKSYLLNIITTSIIMVNNKQKQGLNVFFCLYLKQIAWIQAL